MPFPQEGSSTPKSCYSHERIAPEESVNRGHCTQTAMSSTLSLTSRIVSFHYTLLWRAITFFPVLSGTFVEAQVRDFSETDGDELAEDYGYSSDSDLEEEFDFEGPAPVVTPTPVGLRVEEVPCGQYEESALAGKVIEVKDVAFIT